ncbi:MAG: glycosyltransferase [Selenomonadaceae bacterium]|nr:glycosyltransferase [Selenomonadaceae bacterium]
MPDSMNNDAVGIAAEAKDLTTTLSPSILILTASIGSGHVKAAEAVARELTRLCPSSRISIVDFTRWGTSWANAFMKNVYLLMLRFVPNLYNLMYRFSGGRYGGLSIQSLISVLTQPDIKALLKKYQPDVIVSTHPFPAGAVSWYRSDERRGGFSASTVITDYSIHQMWIYQHIDKYFVARETMKTDLIAAGLDPEQVYVTGIPISVSEDTRTREEIAAGFHVDISRPVVLLMGGGLGLGGVVEVLRELEKVPERLELLVVAGKNDELQHSAREIALKSHHGIKVWGYTDRVHDLMRISTLLVSKPGALTITEALALRLPMVLHSPIPGPETENAVYIARRGAAIWVGRDNTTGSAVAEAITSPDKLKAMQGAAAKLAKPAAAENIAGAILDELRGKLL